MRPLPHRSLAACAVWLAAIVAAPGLEREVEFRDGSRLPLEINDLRFMLRDADDQHAAPQPVGLSETSELVFSEEPAFDRLQRLGELLKQLRSDSYSEREHAATGLVRHGTQFRPLLEETLRSSEDLEFRWRLLSVLERLPRARMDDFDYARGRGVLVRGEFAAWETTAHYRGSLITLNRETVRAIRHRVDRHEGSPPEFEAITAFDPDRVPPVIHTAGFEMAADGSRLSPEESIELAYSEWGVRFTTSIENSYVGVTQYEIAGAEGKQAAATIEPLFEGVITARFHPPNRPDLAAGVHFVSCRLAVVQKDSTALVAFDKYGNEIGRSVVEEGPHSYLAVSSGLPIASVQIVPDTDIDGNYTFDDFAFDTPQLLSDAPHPNHFTLLIKDAARLQCSGFDVDRMDSTSLIARPAAPFATQLRVPLEDIESIMPPTESRNPESAAEDAVWATLTDNSMMLTKRGNDGGPPLSVGGVSVEALPVVALWRTEMPLQEPREPLAIPKGGAALLIRDPTYLTPIEFRKEQFVGKGDDGSTIFYNYERIPPIWFKVPGDRRLPPEGVERMPCVVSVKGEIYHTDPEAVFELGEITSSAVALSVRDAEGTPFLVPWDRIATVDLPSVSASGKSSTAVE